jgi:hypothetical protein
VRRCSDDCRSGKCRGDDDDDDPVIYFNNYTQTIGLINVSSLGAINLGSKGVEKKGSWLWLWIILLIILILFLIWVIRFVL